MINRIRALVEGIAKGIVDTEASVRVRIIDTEESTVFELHVLKAELGQVIGTRGKLSNGIRAIIKAMACKSYHKKVYLNIIGD